MNASPHSLPTAKRSLLAMARLGDGIDAGDVAVRIQSTNVVGTALTIPTYSESGRHS